MPQRKSENDVLFNNGVFPVIISDFHNESILKVNNVFTEWFKQTNPDISIISINGKRIQIMEQLKKEGICENFSLTVRHKNGKNIQCLATASIAKDRNEKEKIIIIIHESLENKKETETLKNQSANLYALSENIDGLFWSVDSHLNVVNYNTEFTKSLIDTFGLTINLGDNILEKMPQEFHDEWKIRYLNALKGEKAKYIDNLLGGTVESSFIPIFSEYREVIGVCNTIINITEKINIQKNLEVIHKRFSSILNSSADAAIIATDPQGIIRQFNRGASVMLDYSHEEIIGKSILQDLFSEAFIKELKAFIYSQKGKKVNTEELFPYCSDHQELVNQKNWFFTDKYGKSIDIKISISTVQMENDEFAGILIIAQDISELNRIKEELEEAKLLAEEISRTKTSFLANMSHEIRTPLNGIIGMTDLLKGTELSSVQKNYSSIILKSANSLLLLINDILDYSKIEAGKLKLGIVSFDLRSLMDDIKDMLLINVKERNIDFDIRIDPSVSEKLIGDPRRIKQILLNLVGNALKFTLKGFIEIDIYQISEIDRDITLYFKVIDSGIGISQDEKIKLFKTFSQVDTSTTRKYGGTGLGLAISKELVSMMDGEIGVVSRKNEGSTFWFTIKVKKEIESFNKNRILLVNSNKMSTKVLLKNLKNMEIQLFSCESSEECITELQSAEKKGIFYDVIIIDENLNDSDGRKLALRIRENRDFDYLKLILTSYTTEELDAEISEKTDFSALIKLPTTQEIVEKCLKDILKNNGSQIPGTKETEEIDSKTVEENEELIKVLVAEDNKINQLVAMNFLKKLGYDADLAENGEEAVNAYRDKYYDLILMDQMMPVMDGIEATKEIRKGGSDISNKDILIIALTANAMKGDREILLESGMDDYISKPVLLKDIKAVIEKNLKQKGRIKF